MMIQLPLQFVGPQKPALKREFWTPVGRGFASNRNGKEQIQGVVGKHSTTPVTAFCSARLEPAANCGIGNVPSVCASDTTKNERLVPQAFSNFEVGFRFFGGGPSIPRGENRIAHGQ